MLWTEAKDLFHFERNSKIWCGASDRTLRLVGTAAVAAEGGRDTRVLGDPMNPIRRQSYLAKHNEHTVQQDTNMAL